MTSREVNELCDISYFSKFGYDEKRIITLDIPFKETNTPYPIDFRNESDLQKNVSENRL